LRSCTGTLDESEIPCSAHFLNCATECDQK
jgi:hypothetical protein